MDQWYYRYLVSVIVFTLIVFLNLYGIDVVGWTQYFFAALVLTPIFILIFLSFPFWSASKISISNRPKVYDFGLLFSNLVWQCTGFDQSTNMSGEVTRPNKTYPISLSIVIVLVIICFFFPIISGVMVDPNTDHWENGAFSLISLQLAGCSNGWLQYWLIIAGGISSMSVLNGYVTCSSRELYRNAKTGALPFGRWIAKLTDCRKKKKEKNDRKLKINSDDNKPDNNEAEIQVHNNQAHSSQKHYEFTVNELTLAQHEEDEDNNNNAHVGNNVQQQSDTSVPFIAILCVSILPTIIQFLSFEQLLTISAFLIGTSLLFQLYFYIYARHGRYGYYAHNVVTKTQFHLRGGLATSICICISPLICVFVLWVAQGWQPLVIYLCVQVFMVVLWMMEICIKNRKKAKQQQQQLLKNDLAHNAADEDANNFAHQRKIQLKLDDNDDNVLD